jgi:hypothetical protein
MFVLRNPIHGAISTGTITAYFGAILLILINNPSIITGNIPSQYATLVLGVIVLIYNLITPGLVSPVAPEGA